MGRGLAPKWRDTKKTLDVFRQSPERYRFIKWHARELVARQAGLLGRSPCAVAIRAYCPGCLNQYGPLPIGGFTTL